jgi:hypothetical protein
MGKLEGNAFIGFEVLRLFLCQTPFLRIRLDSRSWYLIGRSWIPFVRPAISDDDSKSIARSIASGRIFNLPRKPQSVSKSTRTSANKRLVQASKKRTISVFGASIPYVFSMNEDDDVRNVGNFPE